MQVLWPFVRTVFYVGFVIKQNGLACWLLAFLKKKLAHLGQILHRGCQICINWKMSRKNDRGISFTLKFGNSWIGQFGHFCTRLCTSFWSKSTWGRLSWNSTTSWISIRRFFLSGYFLDNVQFKLNLNNFGTHEVKFALHLSCKVTDEGQNFIIFQNLSKKFSRECAFTQRKKIKSLCVHVDHPISAFLIVCVQALTTLT